MAPDIPTGEWGIYPPYSGESLIDVAVSPAGRTLMTWVTDDGVRASLAGEPSALVARGRSKGTLRAWSTTPEPRSSPSVVDAGG